MVYIVFAYFSRITWTTKCKWIFYGLSSNRELPKCSCPWVKQSVIALKWIILYLAVTCQSKSGKRNRCTFWVTAISVHLGVIYWLLADLRVGDVERRETEDFLPHSSISWVIVPKEKSSESESLNKCLSLMFVVLFTAGSFWIGGLHWREKSKPGLFHCLKSNCF